MSPNRNEENMDIEKMANNDDEELFESRSRSKKQAAILIKFLLKEILYTTHFAQAILYD